jgi:hypothetical protein
MVIFMVCISPFPSLNIMFTLLMLGLMCTIVLLLTSMYLPVSLVYSMLIIALSARPKGYCL